MQAGPGQGYSTQLFMGDGIGVTSVPVEQGGLASVSIPTYMILL